MANDSDGSRSDSGGEEFVGDTPAPASGSYETVNLFGRRTGHRVTVQKGENLPALPRGFGWVRVEPNPGADV